MVKNPVEFSAAQKMTLTMLGYQRWLPRAYFTASPRGESPQVIIPPQTPPPLPSTPNLPPVSVVKEDSAADKSLFRVSLGASGATLTICRDYVFLSSELLPCLFLLPPLWANATGLHCFATPAEKKLWLNAWQVLDIPALTDIFSALFAAEIPLQTVPDWPLSQTLKDNQKPLVCVGKLFGLEIPAQFARFDLIHPWILLQKPLMKKTFWLQLLTLKEKLF